MLDDWLALGGNEVLNRERAYAYATQGDCPPGWLQCVPCPVLPEALGEDYSDMTQAPWYDADDETTHRFYGAYPISIENLSGSTRTAEITEGILDGGVIGGSRHAVRQVRCTALLLGRQMDALEYGMSWLSQALAPATCGTHGSACGEQDACFFVSCPPERGTNPGFTDWSINARNLATNPSFETTSGTVEVWRNLATNPSFETTSGTVEVRRNYATNPSAEVDLTGWTAVGTPTSSIARDTALPLAIPGVASVKVTLPAGGNGGMRLSVPGLTVGVQYTVSFWVYDPTTGGTVGGIQSTVTNIGYGTNTTAHNAWVKLSMTFTATATTHLVGVDPMVPASVTAGMVFYVDGVQVEAGTSTGSYFDGANRPRLRENFALNPSAEVDASNWGFTNGGTSTIVRSTARAQSGAASFLFTYGAEVAMGDSGPGPFHNLTLAVGETVTVSAYVYQTEVIGGGLRMGLYGAATAPGGTTRGAATTTINAWSRISHTFTATAAGPVSVFIGNVNGGATIGGKQFWVDAMLIEKSSTVGTYFDGATDPSDDTTLDVAWTGTANASTSYVYDPDLTASWTGTANASASVVTGVSLPGVSTSTVVRGIQSSRWALSGARSMRVVPVTSSNPDTFVSMNLLSLGLQEGKTYTILATLRQIAPLTGSAMSSSQDRNLFLDITGGGGGTRGFGQTTPQANVAGTYEHRITVSVPLVGGSPVTALNLRFYHGHAPGSGDVWWDNLVIVEGVYTGPYFDGGQRPRLRENLVPYPRGGGSWGTGFGTGGAGAATTSIVAGFAAPAVTLTWATAPSNNQSIFANAGGVPVVPGRTYVLSYKSRRTGTWTALPEFYSPGGTLGARTRITNADGSITTWATWVPDATTTSLGFTMSLSNTGTVPAVGDTWVVGEPLMEAGSTPSVYFDGATPPADGSGLASAWTGTANASWSYVYDQDLTAAWTGTAHASASTLTAPRAATATVGFNSVTVSSTHWAKSGSRSIHVIPTTASNGSQVDILGDAWIRANLKPSTAYTILATVRLVQAQTGTIASNARSIFVHLNAADVPTPASAQAPNAAGVTSLRHSFTTPATLAGYNAIRLVNGATGGNGDVWWDDMLLIEGEYTGDYFDGSTAGTDLERYSWAGTAHASVSTKETREAVDIPWSDEDYALVVDRWRRVLHSVTTISGPIVTQTLHRGDWWGYLVEFTLAAGSPHVYSLPEPIEIVRSPAVGVQDNPYNLVPVPSAETRDGTVVVATNYVTNPSLETGITGWSTGVTTITPAPTVTQGNTASGDLAASGTRSLKLALTASNSGTAGVVFAYADVALPAYLAGQRFSFTAWSALVLTSGTAALSGMRYRVEWRDASATLSSDTIGTGPASGGVISSKSLVRPAAAITARVFVNGELTSWSSGAVLNMFVDAVGVTVP